MAESHGEAKGTTAHTEADGGQNARFRRSRRTPLLRNWCRWSIAFVALYLIVSRIALPRVGSVLDARQNAIEGDLAEAAEAEGRVRRRAEGL